MKKSLILLLTVCILITVTACVPQNKVDNTIPFSKENDSLDFTFEEAVYLSTNVFIGEYVECVEKNDGVSYIFKVFQNIKGMLTDETVNVFDPNGYIEYIGANSEIIKRVDKKYSVGEKYLLITEKRVSVFFDTDRYLTISQILLPLSSIAEMKMGNVNISEKSSSIKMSWTVDELLSYVEECVEKNTTDNAIVKQIKEIYYPNGKEYYGLDYIRSNDVDEIIAKSPLILKIKITGGEVNTISSIHGIYTFETVKTYKGKDIDKNEILLPATANIKIGKEYLVMASEKSTGRLIISAKNSVFCGSEIEEIENKLAK